MPTQAKIISALFVGGVVAILFVGWVGWPGFLSVATGAVFGVAFMIIATSLGDDPRAADAAWRSRATDLMGAYAGSETGLVQLPPYGPVPEPAGEVREADGTGETTATTGDATAGMGAEPATTGAARVGPGPGAVPGMDTVPGHQPE